MQLIPGSKAAKIEAEIAEIEKLDFHLCPEELRERHKVLVKQRLSMAPLVNTLALLGLA